MSNDTIVIKNAAAVTYARGEAARILESWVPGMRIWAPSADILLEAALAELAGDVLRKPVVLERMYSNRGRRGEYAGHEVLIDEDQE